MYFTSRHFKLLLTNRRCQNSITQIPILLCDKFKRTEIIKSIWIISLGEGWRKLQYKTWVTVNSNTELPRALTAPSSNLPVNQANEPGVLINLSLLTHTRTQRIADGEINYLYFRHCWWQLWSISTAGIRNTV